MRPSNTKINMGDRRGGLCCGLVTCWSNLILRLTEYSDLIKSFIVGNKKKVINVHKCPKCRCGKTYTTGNMIKYPNHYQKWWCAHCGWLVGLVDNSLHISCWAFKDNNFIIDF